MLHLKRREKYAFCTTKITALCTEIIKHEEFIIHRHYTVPATSSDWNISLNKNNPEVCHSCMIYVTLEDTTASLKEHLVEHSQVKLKAYSKEIVPSHKLNVKEKKFPQNIRYVVVSQNIFSAAGNVRHSV